MKKHKIIKVVLLILVAGILVFLIGLWGMFGEKVRAAGTVKKLNEDLYYMEYIGNYGFADYLKQGGTASDEEMAKYIIHFLSNGFYEPKEYKVNATEYGCSALVVENKNGGYLMGRNYDWTACSAMIVHTKPEEGYESFSTCCLDFIGFGENWRPEGFANQYMALAAIYVPLDGMNEKGLCIADLMAGDKVETHQHTEKPDLTTTAAIRMVLDYAATVEEALDLLVKYDMNSAIGSAHHYMIADATGKSVVVEYVDNKMIVTESPIVTNHYLAEEKFGIGSRSSHKRFDTLTTLRQDYKGKMGMDELRECMKVVSQGTKPSEENTIWTICYNMDGLCMDYYWKENYKERYGAVLLDKGGSGIYLPSK